MNTDYKLIREKYRKFKGEDEYNENGLAILLNSYELLETISSTSKIKRPALHEIAQNNFIVNAATTIETYFKGVVIEGKNFKQDGYENLLKEKITLNEAYDLFKKVNVTRQYIVSHFYSFQTLESIEKVFSSLTGNKFFNEIERIPIEGPKKRTLLDSHPDWRSLFSEIITTRNRYVHEGIYDAINLKKIERYFSIIVIIILASEQYLVKTKHLLPYK